ncbi:glycosyltransferase [Pseudomonas gingeri]
MIGVVIPVHNEQALLQACLESLAAAAREARDAGEKVEILVVLDTCSDDSGRIAQACGVRTLEVRQGNVGFARRAGAAYMLERGARWLACTDADSTVPQNWLLRQLAFDADAVCGTVRVDDWAAEHSPAVRQRYQHLYHAEEGHRHIHGANLGIRADAYRRAGGFKPLPAHEDVHLVQDLQRSGAHIVWTALNSVKTSSRLDSRARGGFGDYLKSLGEDSSLPSHS